MTGFAKLLTAAALLGPALAPAGAQVPYPYSQTYPPQTYPQYPQTVPQYPQQVPGYPQTYPQYPQNYPYQDYRDRDRADDNGGNVIGDIIDQLLGNRYTVTDRQAVRRCANAAIAQAGSQYGSYGYRGYGYNNYGGPRVTEITGVQRRGNGVRVSGLMSNGGYGRYNNNYAYNQLSFRCDVDYRGGVYNIRVHPAGYRG